MGTDRNYSCHSPFTIHHSPFALSGRWEVDGQECPSYLLSYGQECPSYLGVMAFWRIFAAAGAATVPP